MPYKNINIQRAFQRDRVKRRRKEYLSINGPCKYCGSSKNLEVHHKNPKLKISHRIWAWSKEKMMDELKKCIILCHKCHVEETWKNKRAKHGTNSKYSAGCKCKLCKFAHALNTKLYRKKIKLGGVRS